MASSTPFFPPSKYGDFRPFFFFQKKKPFVHLVMPFFSGCQMVNLIRHKKNPDVYNKRTIEFHERMDKDSTALRWVFDFLENHGHI
jgi:hypothetical protein